MLAMIRRHLSACPQWSIHGRMRTPLASVNTAYAEHQRAKLQAKLTVTYAKVHSVFADDACSRVLPNLYIPPALTWTALGVLPPCPIIPRPDNFWIRPCMSIFC